MADQCHDIHGKWTLLFLLTQLDGCVHALCLWWPSRNFYLCLVDEFFAIRGHHESIIRSNCVESCRQKMMVPRFNILDDAKPLCISWSGPALPPVPGLQHQNYQVAYFTSLEPFVSFTSCWNCRHPYSVFPAPSFLPFHFPREQVRPGISVRPFHSGPRPVLIHDCLFPAF